MAAGSSLSQPPLLASLSLPTFSSTLSADEKSNATTRPGVGDPGMNLKRSSITSEWLRPKDPRLRLLGKVKGGTSQWVTCQAEARYNNTHSLRWKVPDHGTMELPAENDFHWKTSEFGWSNAVENTGHRSFQAGWRSLSATAPGPFWKDKGDQRVGEAPLKLEKKISGINRKTKLAAKAEIAAALRKRTSLFLPYPACSKDLSFMREVTTQHFMGGESTERWKLLLNHFGSFTLVFEVSESPGTGALKRCAYEGIYGPVGFRAGKGVGEQELMPSMLGTVTAELELQCFFYEQCNAQWDPTAGYGGSDARPMEDLEVPALVERCKTKFKVTLMPPADPEEAQLGPFQDHSKPSPWPVPSSTSEVPLAGHNFPPKALEHASTYHGWKPVTMRRCRGHCWAYPEANTFMIGGLGGEQGAVNRTMCLTPADYSRLSARSPTRAQLASPALTKVWERSKRDGVTF